MQRYLSLFLLIGVIVISTLTIQNISLNQQEALSVSSGVKVPVYDPLSSTATPQKTTPTSVSSVPSSSIAPIPTASNQGGINYVSPNQLAPTTPTSYGPNDTIPTDHPVTTGPSLNTDLFRANDGSNNSSEVMLLQQFLIKTGYLGADYATGYFGPLTETAVMALQWANGISPAVGYVGPVTRSLILTGMYQGRQIVDNKCNCSTAGPNHDQAGKITGNSCYVSDCTGSPTSTN